MRSFSTDRTKYISGFAAILIIPSRLITVAPFAFYILMQKKGLKKKIKIIMCFIISTVLSIMFYIYNAGRAPLMYFVLSFAMIYVYKFVKRPWKYILIVAVLAMPLLDVLDSFSLFLQQGTWNPIKVDYLSYINQFATPFRNIANMTDIANTFGFRWGSDFITSIVGLIPGVNFPASYENTSLFFGGENWKTTGGIPNDLITFSYIQLGVIGVILIFALIGFLVGKIDRVFIKMPDGKIKILLCSAIAIYLFGIILNADFVSFIRGGFILICLAIIVLSSYNRRE